MKILIVFAISSISLYSQYTLAKSDKDIIEVHASKRKSITTHKDLYIFKDISDFNLYSFEESRLNITSLKGASRTKFVQIRGVGERSDYTPLVFRSVGVFHEGIDYSNFPQALSGWGVDDMKVTYGPRISERIAGVIESFDSKKNQQRFHLSLTDEVSRQLGALHRDNKLFLSVFKKNSDGYYNNSYLGKETNEKDELFLKGSYNFGSFKQIIHYTKQNNGYDAFDLNNTFNTSSDRPGRDNLELLVLRSEKSINNTDLWYEFLKANTLYGYDEDWSFSDSYDYNINFEKKRSRHSLGFSHNYSSFTLRGEYVSIDEKQVEHGFNSGVTRKYIVGDIQRNSFDINVKHSKKLNKKFNLNSTLSVMKTDIDYKNNQDFQKSKAYYPTSMSVSLESGHSYIKLAAGTKSGGFSTQDDVPENRKVFDKEELYSLDTGHELTISKLNLIMQMNFFFNARRNTQVTTSFQDDPSDPSSFTFYIDNAASSHSYGLESKTMFLPLDWLTFSLDMGLIRSQYGDYQVGSRELRNRELPYTPNYQLRLLGRIEFDRNLFASLVFNKQDNYYFSNSHDQKGVGFETFDFRINYKRGLQSYSIFINNILDVDYQTRGFFFGNRPPNYDKELFTQRGVPRTVGVALDFSY